MVLVERRVAVFRREFDFLVGAECFRVAIDGDDVVVAGEKPRAVVHSFHRAMIAQRVVIRIGIRVVVSGQTREIERLRSGARVIRQKCCGVPAHRCMSRSPCSRVV